MDLVPEMLGSGTSIPYLATVGSLAQSQHLLQSLGHDLLPLVQKLLLPVTEIKAQAQVQVPRAASCGMGVGCWMTVQWRVASGQASFSAGADTHSVEPLRKIPPEPDLPTPWMSRAGRKAPAFPA